MKKVRVFPTRAGGIALLFVAALFAGNVRLGAAPAAPVQNPAVVLGPDVTLSWTPVPGATSYRLAVGVAPGQTALSQSVGNVSQIGVKAPFVGTYYVRVFASDGTGEGPASNEVPVVVTAMFVPPAAPTDLAAYVNGTSALITWSGGAAGPRPALCCSPVRRRARPTSARSPLGWARSCRCRTSARATTTFGSRRRMRAD